MKSSLIFIILIIPFSICAQPHKNKMGAIKGSISSADGRGVPYVSVLLKNTGRGTTTDELGNFQIEEIKPGNYIVNITMLGYIDSTIRVEVKPNESYFLKVQLRGTYAELNAVIVAANPHSNYVQTKTSASIKLNLPILEVPQDIDIVTHQLLADQGALSMSEAIRAVSGIVKYAGGLNDYNLLIRGTDATWSVFRNGVGGYWWNQQEDAAMLEKIEFIKGPAGFMISVAQPGGVVNNITKQPVKERIANIEAGFGSYNMMRLTADFGGALTKNNQLTYRLNAGVHYQQRAFQYSNAYRYFVCAALKYEPDKRTSLTAEYNFMYGKTSGNNVDVPSVDGKMFALPRDFAIANASSDETLVKDASYRVELKHSFNDNWRLFAQAAYMQGSWGGYMLNSDDYIGVSNDTLYRISSFTDWRNFSLVAQAYVDGKFNTGPAIEHRVLAGIDHCHAGYNDVLGDTVDPRFGLNLKQPQYYVDPAVLKNFTLVPTTDLIWGWTSLYLQDHIKIAGKLVITLAAHLTHAPLYFQDPDVPDYQKNTHNNVVSPRAGLTWLFSDNLSAYVLYDECFWAQQQRNIENKPFLPLTGYDFETGIKSYFYNKKLLLNLSLYNIVKNNTLTADPQNFGYFIQTGQIVSRGIDFDVTGNITAALTVNATYAYTNAKITKDSDPNQVGMKNFGTPDHYGNLWLKYSLLRGKLKNLSLALGYQHMGERNAEVNWLPGEKINYLPVYNLLDVAISYHKEKYNISLNVYNLTNSNYAALGSFNSDINEWRYTPGEPINFRLSFGVSL